MWELHRAPHELDRLSTPEEAERMADVIASKGDGLLFRCENTREAIRTLITAAAVLAFQPGGVTVLGLTFDARVLVGAWDRDTCARDRGRP